MQARDHYPLLDAARGLAAMIVACFHFKATLAPHYLQQAYLAVDLFFIMSGLVIARSYEAKILNGTMSFADFCITRLIRLWPLYLLGVTLNFAYIATKTILLHQGPFEPYYIPNFLFNLFFLPFVSSEPDLYFFNRPAWSLGLELLINLLYITYAVRRSTRTLALITAACAAAFLLLSYFENTVDMGVEWHNAHGGPLRIGFSFTLGILIYRLMHRLPTNLPPAIGYLLLAAITAMLIAPVSTANLSYSWLFIFLIAPAFTIAACRTQIAAALHPICNYLGRISYAIYILHIPLIFWVGSVYKTATGVTLVQEPNPHGWVVYIGILITAHLALILYDEPIRTKLRAYFSRHNAPKSA